MRRKNGTLAHRGVSTCSVLAAKVSVVESGWKPFSSRTPTTLVPPCQPAVYWPRAVVSSNGSTSFVAESALIFSPRSESGEKDSGSSITVRASSCIRWFWITSRAAPMPS